MARFALALVLAATAGGLIGASSAWSSPQPPQAKLTVSYWPQGATLHAEAKIWTLRCRPTAGSHPWARAACARLVALPDRYAAFAPTPPSRACSMIYGGPEQARVSGVLDGRRIDARFSRGNGCEVARWQRLIPLLPPPPRISAVIGAAAASAASAGMAGSSTCRSNARNAAG